MLFMFTPAQARQLAAVADAASKDAYRPVIGAVLFTYEFDKGGRAEVNAIATDSYVLARRRLRLNDLQAVEEEEAPATRHKATGDAPGQVLVPAKEWKVALKEAAKEAKFGEVEFWITPDRKEVKVQVEMGDKLTYRRTLSPIEGQFPDWKKLMPEVWLRDGELALPCLDPTKLVQLASCVSTLPSERGNKPWRIGASAGAGTNGELKPWGFVIPEGVDDPSELTCLVMPVRIP
ncbi:MAG: hypothetical protein EP299_01785 [Acidobacteria bacterium]|nr:MAG: hypothetical protein EP299_01785 [Acidobacteriota bacterium]